MRFFKKTGTEWEIASEIAISRDLDFCGIFSGSRDEFNGLDQAYLSHAGWGGGTWGNVHISSGGEADLEGVSD